MKENAQKSLFLKLQWCIRYIIQWVQRKGTNYGPLIKNVKGTLHKSLCSVRDSRSFCKWVLEIEPYSSVENTIMGLSPF